MEKREKYYIGYELNNRFALITYYKDGMKEPVSLKEDSGKEQYRMETVIAKEAPQLPWVIGKEAEALDAQRVLKIYHLYPRALKKEECEFFGRSISMIDLLEEFIRRSLEMIPGIKNFSEIKRITFTVEKVDLQARLMMKHIMEKLEIPWKKVILTDNKESLFTFVYARRMDVWNQEICHFEYQQGVLKSVILEKDEGMRPVIVRSKERVYQKFTSLELGESEEHSLDVRKDEAFLEIIEDLFRKRNISYIFLTGDGFEGDWMKKSRNYICRNHKVYRGANLYAKGACYRALYPQEENRLGFLYFGENKIQINAGIHLDVQGKEEIRFLISAGEDWFDMEKECEVILKKEPYLELTFQFMDEKEERTEQLPLAELPERPENTTRLKIQVIPYSPEHAKLRITDLGFGDLFPRTEKIWEFMIPIKKYFRRIQDIL